MKSSFGVLCLLLGVTVGQYGGGYSGGYGGGYGYGYSGGSGGSMMEYLCRYYRQYYPQVCGFQRPPTPPPTTPPPVQSISQYYSSFMGLPMSFYNNYMTNILGGCPAYSGYAYAYYMYGMGRHKREAVFKREKRAFTSAESQMFENIKKSVNQVIERYNRGYPDVMNTFLKDNYKILDQYNNVFAEVLKLLEPVALKALAASAVGTERLARLEKTLAMSGQDTKTNQVEIILARNKILSNQLPMTDRNLYRLALRNNKEFQARSGTDKIKTLNAMVKLSQVPDTRMQYCVNQYTSRTLFLMLYVMLPDRANHIGKLPHNTLCGCG